MPKKQSFTTNSRITSVLRRLWMMSRERAAATKRENNTCQDCNTKGSKAKGKECAIEIHHLEPINWKRIIEVIREELLVHPDKLKVLCKPCHKKETYNDKEK